MDISSQFRDSKAKFSLWYLIDTSPPSFSNKQGLISLQPTLNKFASLPKEAHVQTRAALVDLLSDNDIRKKYAIPLSKVQNHLPMETKNFSDFYCSFEHTRNVRLPQLHSLHPDTQNTSAPNSSL